MIVLPLLAVIYFTHSIDRANLGNAKTAGLEHDLGLKAGQYSLTLIFFYIPYGTMNIPATVLAKQFSPGLVIPCLMFAWGGISLGAAACKNWHGLIATRVLLGAVEAGFVSCSLIRSLTIFVDIDPSFRPPFTTFRCSTLVMRVRLSNTSHFGCITNIEKLLREFQSSIRWDGWQMQHPA